MRTKRTWFPPLLLALALALSGCVPVPPSDDKGLVAGVSSLPHAVPVSPEEVRLPWFQADTLNQFSCETLQNYYLAGLLCDPLVALDSQGLPSNRLALEIATADQVQFTVTLRGDAIFSDGSTLTAQDVLYSLTLAQASPHFAGGLMGVASAEALGDSTLTITLSAPDQYFPRSLMFPVVKNGTGEFPVPVGVGRFLPQTENNALVRNNSYYNPVRNVKQVSLVPTSSLEEQSYGIMEGTIDLMYSDLQSNLNLGLGMGYRKIPLSNLIYLGVNHYKSWSSKTMRQVISGLIRREDLARRAYTGFAGVTSLPMNPSTAATALDAADLEVHLDKQLAALESDGWALQEDGSRRRNGIPLSLELLVNADSGERSSAAEQIAEMLRQAGFQITVVTEPFDQYKARIATGNYDLCIAETRISYNMEIAKLILPTTGGEFPAPLFPALSDLYYQVRAGKAEAAELETMLREELPVIPLLFRRGILCFSRDFSANIVATEQDIFYNVGEW